MRCGISTACFYPENTLDALKRVAGLGAPVAELFLNTFSEMEDDFLARLKAVADAIDTKIVSLHPFTSPMEGLLFATDYEGRVEDGIALYRRYYEICKLLGADKLIFHGVNKTNCDYPPEKYAIHIRKLALVGQEYGVTLCYENVFYCRLGNPTIVREMRPLFGDEIGYTLDLKQLRRQGTTLESMLKAMGSNIQQVHISDKNHEQDCISPGLGTFDFAGLVQKLAAQGYDGDLIIELYRDGFDEPAQLKAAMQYVQRIIDEAGCSSNRGNKQ